MYRIYRGCQEAYGAYLVIYWGHLSRLTNFLVILNISLFFVLWSCQYPFG